ncbi:ferric reductase like transmembrane component-domain-containing protein, partial [Dioszegia hungarica]
MAVSISTGASTSISAAPVPHAPPAWTFEPGRESLLAIAVVVLSLTLSHLVQRVKTRRLIRKRNNYPVDTPSNALQSSRPEAPRLTLIRAVKARTSTLLYLYIIPSWLYAPETIADAIWTGVYCVMMLFCSIWQCPISGTILPPLTNLQAYAQTPIIFLLAVKNNPLSPLTGITYQKLNYLHRASARACIVFAWLHAVLWFLPVLCAGHLFRWYIIWGTVALLGFTGLWGTSVRSLRRRSFEFFLVTHILFSAAFILGAILHWPLQAYWIWPALAIWSLDRLIRLARLAYINRSHLRRGGALIKDCTIEIVSRDVLRVTVIRPGLKWKAGQHFFLSSPATGGSIHESHPFSISNLPSPSGSGSGDVIFLIRAHNGFTRRLLLSAPSQPSLLLEGPYGHSHPLSHYSSLLFISGGTGVTFTLSHFLSVLSAIRTGKGIARRVKLVWHVRHAEDISWITPILDEALAET